MVEEDEGRGIDVTLLHHDIGMVRSQYAMTLQNQPSVDPIVSIKRFNPIDLKMEQVMVSADQNIIRNIFLILWNILG